MKCIFDRSSILFIAWKENTTFSFLRSKFVSDCVSAAFIIHKQYAIKYSVRTFNSHSRGQRRIGNSVENRKAVETLPLLDATRSVKRYLVFSFSHLLVYNNYSNVLTSCVTIVSKYYIT